MNQLNRYVKFVMAALLGICLSHCQAAGNEGLAGRTGGEGRQGNILSLAGTWACQLDPDNRGQREAWQDREIKSTLVTLPGTTQTNEIGPVPHKKLISSLTPTTEYLGAAWYQREIELSESDCQGHIDLFLERCGWVSVVWLNGIALGSQDSLVSPHVYDLSDAARPGKNRLTIVIDNSNRKFQEKSSTDDGSNTEDLVLKADSRKRLNCGGHHAVFGGPCFNGITGRMELQIRQKVRITDLQVYPDVQNRKVRVKVEHTNDLKTASTDRLVLKIQDMSKKSVVSRQFKLTCKPGCQVTEYELSFGKDMRLWDEFDPYLYQLTAQLETPQGLDIQSTEFGMRNLSQVGTQLAINGRVTFLRGELECFVHPLRGYPPTDVDYWLGIFGIYKDHGLNHVRFHTCCPPKAAFGAADRLGIILNVELPGCSGSEPEDAATLNYLQKEALRIVRTFGNHPSFCMMTMGNELLYNGETESSKSQVVLMERVARCRDEDPRHWYCCTAQSHTEGRDDDFYVSAWPKGAYGYGNRVTEGEPLTGIRWSGFDVVDSSRFNTRPPETASDYRNEIAGIDKPMFTHEVGQWAVYPDIGEIEEFTGPFKANNLEIIRDFMKTKGTLSLADDFVRASGNLSLLLYKEEIESTLRTPGLGGVQLLGFHDHPPQGTSTIGIVTALRKSKGLVTAEQFRQFCSQTVPLARLHRRTFTNKDSLTADVEVAHYGPRDLKSTEFRWQLSTDKGKTIAEGSFKRRDIPTGGLTRVGKVVASLDAVDVPVKAVLRVFAPKTEIVNSWDLWIYPGPETKKEKPVRWVRHWSAEIAAEVAAGSTVVVELSKEQIPGATRGCFTTVFWNPIMKRYQHALTMGILCDPGHSAFKAFPTEYYSNWQWWDVLRPSRVLDLDSMDPRPDSLVRMIDSFVGNRCLSVLFEARIGKGKLLVTSLDLSSELAARHAARQLRDSLEAYVVSGSFDPQVAIRPDAIDALVAFYQKTPKRETREEIKKRFDRPVQNKL
ncbi:MAG: hypothetical protein K9M57_09125 [Phycisphaerae bacterium]|nr:hypothetical protein [Phycisphaerae bacterium]